MILISKLQIVFFNCCLIKVDSWGKNIIFFVETYFELKFIPKSPTACDDWVYFELKLIPKSPTVWDDSLKFKQDLTFFLRIIDDCTLTFYDNNFFDAFVAKITPLKELIGSYEMSELRQLL